MTRLRKMMLEEPQGRITALVLGWIADSVVRSDAQASQQASHLPRPSTSATGTCPTVADRIAQQVVKARLEPEEEPLCQVGFGAVGQARKRCWRLNCDLDLDIKSSFDTLSQDLLHARTGCRY